MKSFNEPAGNRTGDLPACSAVELLRWKRKRATVFRVLD